MNNSVMVTKGILAKSTSFYIRLLLFLFSTAFSFAVALDQKNYLVVGIMVISSVFFFVSFSRFSTGEVYVYIFYFSLLFCLLRYPKSFREITLLYTLIFVLTFVVYLRILNAGILEYRSYLILLRNLIYAYFIVLVLQQICVILNYPIINYILGDSEELKLNALAPEPSLSARIVMILFYSFICMREIELRRPYQLFRDSLVDWLPWFCFLYLMLTMGSATALFLLVLFVFVRFFSIPMLLYIFIAALIFYVVSFKSYDSIPLQRIMTFGTAFLTNSPENIIFADHSASIRVLPIYYYLGDVNVFSTDFWLGKGIDYNKYMFPVLIPGLNDDASVGGIFPSLFLNHGMISGLLLILMVYKNCLSRFWSYSALLSAILVYSCGLNTQMSWLVFMLLAANRFFGKSNLSLSIHENRCIA
ncbi:MAG: hypothetical protein HGB22_06195 [Chlorobiaceae bacterium]|nr:hypothetical protein [Chlorobiaceae bacterium]